VTLPGNLKIVLFLNQYDDIMIGDSRSNTFGIMENQTLLRRQQGSQK